MPNIGNFIRTRRRELGLTATALGRQVGTSCAAVSNWENNPSREPSKRFLQPLADALRVSVEELLQGSNTHSPTKALSAEESEVLEIFRSQGTLERTLVLRMLRGLRSRGTRDGTK